MINYKGMLICPRGHCVDVADPVTGKWFVAPTIQSAKWHISILIRLRTQ